MMAQISVTVSGLDGILGRIDDYGHRVRRACAEAADGIADEAVRVMKSLAAVDTGELRDSIGDEDIAKFSGTAADGSALAVVVAGADHAKYVEYGTGPMGEAHHEGIDPDKQPSYTPNPWVYRDREGKARWTYGMPARPFFYPGRLQAEAESARITAQAIAKVVGRA